MPPRHRASVKQLDLLPNETPNEGWWHSQGVFTRPYLKLFIGGRDQVPAADEVLQLFEKLKSRWLENLPGLHF